MPQKWRPQKWRRHVNSSKGIIADIHNTSWCICWCIWENIISYFFLYSTSIWGWPHTTHLAPTVTQSNQEPPCRSTCARHATPMDRALLLHVHVPLLKDLKARNTLLKMLNGRVNTCEIWWAPKHDMSGCSSNYSPWPWGIVSCLIFPRHLVIHHVICSSHDSFIKNCIRKPVVQSVFIKTSASDPKTVNYRNTRYGKIHKHILQQTWQSMNYFNSKSIGVWDLLSCQRSTTPINSM